MGEIIFINPPFSMTPQFSEHGYHVQVEEVGALLQSEKKRHNDMAAKSAAPQALKDFLNSIGFHWLHHHMLHHDISYIVIINHMQPHARVARVCVAAIARMLRLERESRKIEAQKASQVTEDEATAGTIRISKSFGRVSQVGLDMIGLRLI